MDLERSKFVMALVCGIEMESEFILFKILVHVLECIYVYATIFSIFQFLWIFVCFINGILRYEPSNPKFKWSKKEQKTIVGIQTN